MSEIKYIIPAMAVFFIATFLQSGVDKLQHQEGNLSWFKSQFANTFLSKIITPLFWVITIQELVCSGLLIYGMFLLFYTHDASIEIMGFYMCLATLIQLFVGQRIAKDYVGASGVVPYILAAVLSIVIASMFQNF